METKRIILKSNYERFGEAFEFEKLRVFQAFMEIGHQQLAGEKVPVRFGLVWRKAYRKFGNEDGTFCSSVVQLPVVFTVCFPDTKKYFGWKSREMLHMLYYGDFLFHIDFLDPQGEVVVGEEFTVIAGHGSCVRDCESNTKHLLCTRSTSFHADFFDSQSNPEVLSKFKEKCVQLKTFSGNTRQLFFLEANVTVTPLPRVTFYKIGVDIDAETKGNSRQKLRASSKWNFQERQQERRYPESSSQGSRLRSRRFSGIYGSMTAELELDPEPEPEPIVLQFKMDPHIASEEVIDTVIEIENDCTMMDVDVNIDEPISLMERWSLSSSSSPNRSDLDLDLDPNRTKNTGADPVATPSTSASNAITYKSILEMETCEWANENQENLIHLQNPFQLQANRKQHGRKRRKSKVELKKVVPEKSPRKKLEVICEVEVEESEAEVENEQKMDQGQGQSQGQPKPATTLDENGNF